MSTRQSIEPTYDSRETGPRFHVTTEVGGHTVAFREPIPDPFVRTTVTVGKCALLRSLLRGLTVTVTVGGDASAVEDVLELDANYLGSDCTRRDEFNVALGASLHNFRGGDTMSAADELRAAPPVPG